MNPEDEKLSQFTADCSMSVMTHGQVLVLGADPDEVSVYVQDWTCNRCAQCRASSGFGSLTVRTGIREGVFIREDGVFMNVKEKDYSSFVSSVGRRV